MVASHELERWTAKDPCPICGGHQQAERGTGERCHGYRSGTYAYCSCKEHAGSLRPAQNNLYRHWLGIGQCRCGVTHIAGTGGPA